MCGVWAAGGFPLEFPTISLGEVFMRPTTMLYRNLMAMDVEESIRANPIRRSHGPGLRCIAAGAVARPTASKAFCVNSGLIHPACDASRNA